MLVGRIRKKRMRQILWQNFHAAERACEQAITTRRLKRELQRGKRERQRVRVLATSVAECTQSSAALSLHRIVQGITDRAKLGGLLLFFHFFWSSCAMSHRRCVGILTRIKLRYKNSDADSRIEFCLSWGFRYGFYDKIGELRFTPNYYYFLKNYFTLGEMCIL
jgi:hypothetical protein